MVTYDVNIKSLILKPLEVDNCEEILLNEEVENQNVINESKCLYIKDKLFFTDNENKILRSQFQAPIVSLHQIIKHEEILNSNFELHQTNKECVYFTDINKSIENYVSHFLRKLSLEELELIKNILIKICWDGTNVGKTKKFFNFVFSIINDKR